MCTTITAFAFVALLSLSFITALIIRIKGNHIISGRSEGIALPIAGLLTRELLSLSRLIFQLGVIILIIQAISNRVYFSKK